MSAGGKEGRGGRTMCDVPAAESQREMRRGSRRDVPPEIVQQPEELGLPAARGHREARHLLSKKGEAGKRGEAEAKRGSEGEGCESVNVSRAGQGVETAHGAESRGYLLAVSLSSQHSHHPAPRTGPAYSPHTQTAAACP